jgi:hypothetical protein
VDAIAQNGSERFYFVALSSQSRSLGYSTAVPEDLPGWFVKVVIVLGRRWKSQKKQKKASGSTQNHHKTVSSPPSALSTSTEDLFDKPHDTMTHR